MRREPARCTLECAYFPQNKSLLKNCPRLSADCGLLLFPRLLRTAAANVDSSDSTHDVHVRGLKMQDVVCQRIRRKPILPVNQLAPSCKLWKEIGLSFLLLWQDVRDRLARHFHYLEVVVIHPNCA